jgi:hypothetical protein
MLVAPADGAISNVVVFNAVQLGLLMFIGS